MAAPIDPNEVKLKQGMLVTIHYTAWLSDPSKADKKGTKFDSSLDRQQPFSFVLGAKRVIEGLEDVSKMMIGERRTLEIPPAKAYGARRIDPIKENATLIFDVELLDALPTELERISDTLGSGATAKEKSSVAVHYTAWLYDHSKAKHKGMKFARTLDAGSDPLRFVVGEGKVIKGLEEGVKGMKAMSKFELVIPASLAYGARGTGGPIPRNAAVIFEVELLEVN